MIEWFFAQLRDFLTTHRGRRLTAEEIMELQRRRNEETARAAAQKREDELWKRAMDEIRKSRKTK